MKIYLFFKRKNKMIFNFKFSQFDHQNLGLYFDLDSSGNLGPLHLIIEISICRRLLLNGSVC
jgi:hypothetical protein